MEPATIGIIVGLASLIVERAYKYFTRAKKSKFHSECMGIKVDKETEYQDK